jgi:hemerythrin-like domain-containing protein
MADVLAKLDRDHEDFRLLLGILERQLEYLRNGADADLDLIEDVVECCESYTDCAHHPTESMVSEALAHVGAPLPEVSRELHEVHTRIHHLTHGLLSLVQATLQDAIRPRTAFTRVGEQLVSAYRSHIQLEERCVFPAARNALTRREWSRIDAAARRRGAARRPSPRWLDLQKAAPRSHARPKP